jgi:hypothetical protein
MYYKLLIPLCLYIYIIVFMLCIDVVLFICILLQVVVQSIICILLQVVIQSIICKMYQHVKIVKCHVCSNVDVVKEGLLNHIQSVVKLEEEFSLKNIVNNHIFCSFFFTKKAEKKSRKKERIEELSNITQSQHDDRHITITNSVTTHTTDITKLRSTYLVYHT